MKIFSWKWTNHRTVFDWLDHQCNIHPRHADHLSHLVSYLVSLSVNHLKVWWTDWTIDLTQSPHIDISFWPWFKFNFLAKKKCCSIWGLTLVVANVALVGRRSQVLGIYYPPACLASTYIHTALTCITIYTPTAASRDTHITLYYIYTAKATTALDGKEPRKAQHLTRHTIYYTCMVILRFLICKLHGLSSELQIVLFNYITKIIGAPTGFGYEGRKKVWQKTSS